MIGYICLFLTKLKLHLFIALIISLQKCQRQLQKFALKVNFESYFSFKLKIISNLVNNCCIFEAGHTQSASVRLKTQSVKVTFRRQTCQFNAHSRVLKARVSLKNKNEKKNIDPTALLIVKLKRYHSKQHFILSTLRSDSHHHRARVASRLTKVFILSNRSPLTNYC